MIATIKWHQATEKGKLTKKERGEVFTNLLKYCELDTLAMVRILEVLKRVIDYWLLVIIEI